MREAFEESNLPSRVDLFIWGEMSDSFREKIQGHHVSLVSTGSSGGTNSARQTVRTTTASALPTSWKTLGFSELVFFQEGPGIRNWQYRKEGIPFVNIRCLVNGRLDRSRMNCLDPQEVKDKYEHFLLDAGDYVVSSSGTIGRIAEVYPEDLPCMLNTSVIRMRPRRSKLLNRRFLRYFLSSREFQDQIHSFASGSVQVNYGPTHLKQMSILLPPLLDQRAIAQILGTLDDRIELNRRMNETLEATARAIFKDWFADFGPTHAKAKGRAPYLAPEFWDLFPDALDDEGKPEGWQVTLLGDRIEILDSKRIPLSAREREQRRGPYPYHGATGVMDYVDDFLFEGIHVLLGEDGSVIRPDGRPFTQYVWGQFWVNNHAHVLRGKGISNEMLLCFLQHTDIAPYVTGAVQPKLNQRNLKTIPFRASGPEVTAAFEKVVGPLFEQFRLNAEHTHTLSSTRDLLLPKLMSGEIRLREAEKAVEAVV